MPTTPQTTLVITAVAKLLVLLLFFSCSDANGASVRGSRPSSLQVQQSPDADMLKALQYIKALHQREEGEEPEEEEEEPADRSEELLQAVLSTLQQTEKPQSQTSRWKIPLMFEDDEEEGDGGDEERVEPRYENQFKRTNENVEEKYTPQNLATLQSVFDELNKMKILQKRGEEEEEEDEDLFDFRRAYDDSDEEEEEEEEERRKGKVRRAFDYTDENTDEDDDEERSRDADDMAKLMDYYLLKVLEKTEKEEQKREEEEERSRRGEDVDPRLLYQLLTVSQRYQIPPEQLLDLLSAGETQQKSFRPRSRIAEVPHQVSKEKLYRRPPPRNHKTPEEERTEEILRILGLGGEEDTAPSEKQPRPSGRPSGFPTRPAGGLAYLTTKMFAQDPKPAFSSRKTHQNREVANQNEDSSFERRMEEYFGLMDSDKNTDEKRGTEDEEKEEESPSEVMSKLLSLLNPEAGEDDAKKGA